MDYALTPPETLRGTLRVPSDRSITVRAALLAGIAEGVSRIREPLDSDDTRAALQCMADLGVQIAPLSSPCDPPGLRIPGLGLRGLRASSRPLDCRSSGTTMRLLAGFLAGQQFNSTLDGSAQLRRRPMRRVTGPLRAMGARIEDADGHAPLSIHGLCGPLRGIAYDMPIASAQVKSALLLAGLYADGPVTICEPAPTRDHTERMLRAAGVEVIAQADAGGRATITLLPPSQSLHPLDVLVPADFSSAAFFLVAATIVPGAHVRLVEVGLNPTRTGLLDALQAMGAQITIANRRDEGGEPIGDLEVRSAGLAAVEIGGQLAARMIDEFPVFAVAATQAAGVTVVRDAEELRVKESNRLEGFIGELRKLGARIEATADGFVVEGPSPLRGAVVDGLGDHRVAMALGIAGLVAEGTTTILGADCVAKTYPMFFRDLELLRAP
ncbi:MAG: 3-phosphoshikimate 1-carboxyvinyltransferase [Anaerolineae bacterium]|nr:3-phosphoshikimate 1-carboxyvinyltransferase [Anaerolineae bacterium]